jgi:hypothetical protein
MTTEALDPFPLSSLQQGACCPRRCTLIHVEQMFEKNLFTQGAQAGRRPRLRTIQLM